MSWGGNSRRGGNRRRDPEAVLPLLSEANATTNGDGNVRDYAGDVRSAMYSPSGATRPRNNSRYRNGVVLSFANVGYEVADKTILEGVSGIVRPGELLAIMGPTGAGKSTLMDVLACRSKEGTVSGTVLVNGAPPPANFQQLSGYVMQDDALIATLTVRETLEFSLALRVEVGRTPAAARAALVDDIIAVLRLGKVADTRVGDKLKRGISGGERRRLCIGVEMVTSPSVLYIDEPTSGLDSFNALRVVKAIKNLTKAGKTVICTIHQPRSTIFHMFDKLLLLAGGACVYFGSAADSIAYFADQGYPCSPYMNPADFQLDLLEASDDEGSDDDGSEASADTDEQANGMMVDDGDTVPASVRLAQVYATSPEREALMEEISEVAGARHRSSSAGASGGYRLAMEAASGGGGGLFGGSGAETYPISTGRQTLVLMKRTWLATLRDSSIMYVRTGAAVGIGLLVGVIFFGLADNETTNTDRINVLLFLMCVFSLFCLPAISRFIDDRLLFNREHAGGYYCTSAYFVATFSVEVPVLTMIVVAYGCCSYFMVGLQPGASHFFFFLAVIFVVINVGFSIAQVIGAAVKTTNMAIAIYMLVLVYSLLLGGFIVSRDTLPHPIRFLMNTSYFYYGFQSLCINEFEDKAWGADVLDGLGFSGSNKWTDLWVLVGMFGGLRVVAYFALRYLQRVKR